MCAKYQLPRWLQKAKGLIDSYGTELFYFDTLVVQLAPCLSPSHPSTIEENQQARLELAQKTQKFGTVVGFGEGVSPTWRSRDSISSKVLCRCEPTLTLALKFLPAVTRPTWATARLGSGDYPR
jgi:hypothetical protein